MKTTLYYFTEAILLILMYSCNSNSNYIVPFNSEKAYEEAAKNGLTHEESDKISESIYDSIIANTVGKSFPGIKVTNLTNKEINLADDLKDYSIIVSSDLYCGYGKECLLNTFPNSLKKIKNKNINNMEKIILKTKQNLYRIISETTGKSMAQVTKDADRDYYMSSEEAKKYGIVDKIITKR